MSKVNQKHWFLLSYLVQNPGVWTPTSIVVGSEEMHLTIPQLNALKKAYNVPDNSVLLAVSALGWMSEKQINGLPDIDPPTVTSEAYRLGVLAATRVDANDAQQPLNPFGATNTPEEAAKAHDWQEGFTAVRIAQADKDTPVACLQLPDATSPQAEAVSSETKPASLRNPVKPTTTGKP